MHTHNPSLIHQISPVIFVLYNFADTEWRKWDTSTLSAVWNATGLVNQELYDHAGGWPADAPGAFDYEQVNLAVGPAKAEHAATIATLADQLKAHYAVDVQR